MELFGFNISRPDKKEEARKQSFVVPTPEDGTSTINAGGYYGTYVDFTGSIKNESDLIKRYRDIAGYPDCDSAIEDIVNDAIGAADDEKPVTLNLDKVEGLPENIKKIINDEFDELLSLLDFDSRAHDIFRRWYIDGRLYYHKVTDAKVANRGILELRYIDPRKIKKVREVIKDKGQNGVEIVKEIKEYFVYSEKGLVPNSSSNVAVPTTGQATQGIRISKDAITYCPSGVIDLDTNTVVSHLHKAIKPVNQLRMMEDALVIYRISRAPERRIFYIDVGNLPKVKAEQYLKDIMNKYRNKIVYDSTTGEIRDDKKHMSMLEDFWLPRREGGRGTEITTLDGGQTLGQIDDITYFQQKLYQSLNVPVTRLQNQQTFNLGRASEITRDELKFSKFVARLRKRFSELFDDLLKTQLILKRVITEQDWDEIQKDIEYVFAQDQFYLESKETEVLKTRIEILNQIAPYVGIYYSKDFVRRKVLRLSEDDMEQIDKENAEEPMQQPQPGEQIHPGVQYADPEPDQ